MLSFIFHFKKRCDDKYILFSITEHQFFWINLILIHKSTESRVTFRWLLTGTYLNRPWNRNRATDGELGEKTEAQGYGTNNSAISTNERAKLAPRWIHKCTVIMRGCTAGARVRAWEGQFHLWAEHSPPLHLREQREKAQVETSNLSNTDSLLKVDKNFRMVFIEIWYFCSFIIGWKSCKDRGG